MGITRVKCTIQPPPLCSGSCYWEHKSNRETKYVRTVRLEFIKTVKDKKALEVKLKAKSGRKVDERDPDEFHKEREAEQGGGDEEVKDLVESFKRNGKD